MVNLGTFTIGKKFNGPPESGNGGYCAGMLANFANESVRIRLSAPPPLDTPLAVTGKGGELAVHHGETLVMSARAGEVAQTAPASPPLDLARTGVRTYPSAEEHGLPTCFVCGPSRDPSEALCIKAGRVEGYEGAAGAWIVGEQFCDEEGLLRPEIIWAALDCPSAFALPDETGFVLLGEMTARVLERPRAGDELIVTGWHDRSDGRKHWAGAALHSAEGELLAQSDTLWIELKG